MAQSIVRFESHAVIRRPISEVFDNVPFFRQTTSATFEVAWYYQMQLLSDNPAAGVKVVDIAES